MLSEKGKGLERNRIRTAAVAGEGRHRTRERNDMDVALFPGCVVDALYPEVGIAAVRVLRRLGCTVHLPKEAVCCGQPLLNSGFAKESVPAFCTVIDAYANCDRIVSLTGSCMHSIVYDYPPYVADDPIRAAAQKRIAENIREFTDFIVNELGVTDVGARCNAKVTLHKSCHLTRLLGVEEPPLMLLREVEGLEYVEMERAERCCGFGGTFAVKQPEISAAITEEKCRAILDSGAQIVCGGDMACLMNIEGCLRRMRADGRSERDVRVMHIAQILDAGRS